MYHMGDADSINFSFYCVYNRAKPSLKSLVKTEKAMSLQMDKQSSFYE
jgi:hypothetical protein